MKINKNKQFQFESSTAALILPFVTPWKDVVFLLLTNEQMHNIAAAKRLR